MAGVAFAPEVPDWDWQATFEFDSNGDIMSRTLDFSSDRFIDEGTCQGWSIVLEINTSTSNTSHVEIMRVDSTNQLKEHQVQKDGNINQKRSACPGAIQIDMPDPVEPPAGTCDVGILGQACPLSCTAEGMIMAHAVIAVGVLLRASCGGGVADCIPVVVNCKKVDDVANDGSNTHGCAAGVGIWVTAHCHNFEHE